MPQENEPAAPSPPDIQARLREVAAALRESSAVDAGSRAGLAELVEELAGALNSASVPAPEAARLAATVAHLREALRKRHDRGMLSHARDRFEEALLAAEARAPLTAGVVHRLVEALAGIGI
jgi:hypothetical protein